MKKFIFLFLFTCFISQFIDAQIVIQIDKVPKTIDEFVKLRDNHAKTPEGGAAMFCLALKIWTINHTLGNQCFVAIADKSELKAGNTYKGQGLLRAYTILGKLPKDPLIANSYIMGSSPENNYAVALPYKYTVSRNKYSGDPSYGKLKVFVDCSGADAYRPVYVVLSDEGLWKAASWEGLLEPIKSATTSK